MLKKKFRLSKKKDFEKILASKRSAYGRFFAIKVYNSEQENFRAAIIVSKKISKKAVVRNKIRRRAYEILRVNELALKPLDIALITLPASLKANFSELSKDLFLLLKKTEVLNK